jgi:hypothetical protein
MTAKGCQQKSKISAKNFPQSFIILLRLSSCRFLMLVLDCPKIFFSAAPSRLFPQHKEFSISVYLRSFPEWHGMYKNV